MFNINARLSQLRHGLKDNQLLLISKSTDIFYFSGFNNLLPEERETYLVIGLNDAVLLHDSFLQYNHSQQIVSYPGASINQLLTLIKQLQLKLHTSGVELLIDKSNLTVNEFEQLSTIKNLQLIDMSSNLLLNQRLIKDDYEIKQMILASKLTCDVMTKILKKLTTGITELELKKIIEIELLKVNSIQPAFPVIVAFGKNTALPHHQPDGTKLLSETAVLIDIGATVNHYLADMTRSVWFGQQPHSQFLKIEKIVKQAYQQALKQVALKKSIKAQDLDQAARNTIALAGYKQYFIHTTGHGIGLDIHEGLSLNSFNTQVLTSNMVITIEPGIYLPNLFGYRFENTVLIGKDKGVVLTSS